MEGGAMDTLPEGWRMVDAGVRGRSIVAPSGEHFTSRLEVLECLGRQGSGQKVLREMRRSMVEVDGWQESSLLPDGWIYKVMKRGKSFRSSGILWSSEVAYSTREGATLSSVMAVKKYMEDSPRCNFEDLTNFRAFLREDGTTAEELLGQVRDSVEVAPWGLKKYKSNEKPAGKAAGRKVSSIKEPWTDDYDSDEEIKTEKDEEDEKPVETSVVKPKKDYKPFIFEMNPTENAKSARKTINMTRAARRPFVMIVEDSARQQDEKPVETRQTNEKEDVIKKLRRKSVRVVERPVSEEVATPNNKRRLEFMDNPGGTKRRTGCTYGPDCAGCILPECEECKNCKDKPARGGPGRLKQKCLVRKCRLTGKSPEI